MSCNLFLCTINRKTLCESCTCSLSLNDILKGTVMAVKGMRNQLKVVLPSVLDNLADATVTVVLSVMMSA